MSSQLYHEDSIYASSLMGSTHLLKSPTIRFFHRRCGPIAAAGRCGTILRIVYHNHVQPAASRGFVRLPPIRGFAAPSWPSTHPVQPFLRRRLPVHGFCTICPSEVSVVQAVAALSTCMASTSYLRLLDASATISTLLLHGRYWFCCLVLSAAQIPLHGGFCFSP
jgi:hypothetical protein